MTLVKTDVEKSSTSFSEHVLGQYSVGEIAGTLYTLIDIVTTWLMPPVLILDPICDREKYFMYLRTKKHVGKHFLFSF